MRGAQRRHRPVVELIAQVLRTEAWHGDGIRSAEQWVAWKCGMSPWRAQRLVAMARRREELPETAAAHEAGELCEDQVPSCLPVDSAESTGSAG